MSTTSTKSINSKLALIFASATLTVSAAVPALAYQPHEHPFYHDESIKSLTQVQGDGYCRNLFKQLKATGDLGGGFDANKVNHVWAHIKNGDCIANT